MLLVDLCTEFLDQISSRGSERRRRLQQLDDVGLPPEAYRPMCDLAIVLSKRSILSPRAAYDLILKGVLKEWNCHLSQVKSGVYLE